MSSGKKTFLIRMVKLVHLGFSVVLFALFWVLFLYREAVECSPRVSMIMMALYAISMVTFMRIYNGYFVDYYRIRDIVYSQAIACLLSIAIVYVVTALIWNNIYSPLVFLFAYAIQLLFNVIWSYIAHKLFYKINPPLKTLVLYQDDSDIERLYDIRLFNRKYHIIGEIKNPTSNAIKQYMNEIEAIVILSEHTSLSEKTIQRCLLQDISVIYFPRIVDVLISGASHLQSYSTPMLRIGRKHPRIEYEITKRLFDIIASLLALIVLSPLMVITAILIRLSDGGPAIYSQVRLTKNAKTFKIYKFRSMKVGAEDDSGARLASNNDDRITPIGRFIRKVRIDELPQLVNIIKGDMSIVGPRPERPELSKEYEKEMPGFALRLQIKAGLTGYAQIYGKYNTSPYDKLEMDLMYINKMSIFTDLELIFATFRVLISRSSTEGIKGK